MLFRSGQEYHNYDYEEAHERAKKAVSPASSMIDFDKAYTLRNVGEGSGKWEIYRNDIPGVDADGNDVNMEQTLEIIDAETRNQALEQAYEKYTGVIPFKIRPYNPDEPKKEPSPRAKLAQRIKAPKPNWNVVYRPTGRVVDSILNVSHEEAQKLLPKVAELQGFSSIDDLELHNQKDYKPTDNVQDTPMDVAQNFEPNNQVRMPNGVPVWEIYERGNGNVVHTFADHRQREAWSRAQEWLRGINVEDLSLFSVRPKMLAQGEQNIGGEHTPPTSGTRNIPSQSGPNGEEPNYEVYMQRFPGGGALQRFYAASHPEAMDYLSQYRQQAAGAPSEYAIRNLPVNENFANGKGPGRPGDSQRHGIPKGATIAQLEKAAKAKGRKGQLARWQLNMRRGKAKAK